PARLDGSGSPWASPVCSRTPRYRGACAGREPTWALVGAVVTRHRPLIWCDFVSHGLDGMLSPRRETISAVIRPLGTGRRPARRTHGTGPLPPLSGHAFPKRRSMFQRTRVRAEQPVPPVANAVSGRGACARKQLDPGPGALDKGGETPTPEF